MTELRIKYTQNAEWVHAQTGEYSGRLLGIGLREQKVEDIIPQESKEPHREPVIDLTEGRNWSPVISPRGSLEILMPGTYDERLEKWMLTLHGLPRLYPALKMETLEKYFGPELPSSLEHIYTEAVPYRESAGDLRVTEAAKGLRTFAEIQEEDERSMRTLIVPMAEATPQLEKSRQELLDRAVWKSGKFVVSRTVFLKK